MAGLLNTEGYSFYSVKFAIAVAAELLGVLLFAFYGDTAPKEYGAWGNGIALAIVGMPLGDKSLLPLLICQIHQIFFTVPCSIHYRQCQRWSCQSLCHGRLHGFWAHSHLEGVVLHSCPDRGQHLC